MKIIAVNGGPSKKWNTATMLEHFIEGVKAAGHGVETETLRTQFPLDCQAAHDAGRRMADAIAAES